MQELSIVNLCGAWRLREAKVVLGSTGEGRNLYDEQPTGWLVLTPDQRFVAMLGRGDRACSEMASDGQKLFESMMAYTGRFVFAAGGSIRIDVDWTWHPGFARDQVRFLDLVGDALVVRTAPSFHPAYGEAVVATLLWDRAQ